MAALDVVSRNAVRAYRDGEVSFDSLVARLRVGSVVDGTVQRAGDSVRVTVQLVDTSREKQLESRTVICPVGEVRFRQAAAETRSAQALALVFRGEAARMAARGHPLDRASALRLYAAADSFLHGAEAADPAWPRPRVQRGFVALAWAALVAGRERDAFHALAADCCTPSAARGTTTTPACRPTADARSATPAALCRRRIRSA